MCRYGQQRFLAFMRETHAMPGPVLMTVHEQLQSPGMLREGWTMSGGLMGSGSACCGLGIRHVPDGPQPRPVLAQCPDESLMARVVLRRADRVEQDIGSEL